MALSGVDLGFLGSLYDCDVYSVVNLQNLAGKVEESEIIAPLSPTYVLG